MSIFKKLILLVVCTIVFLVTTLCLTGNILTPRLGNSITSEKISAYSEVVQQNVVTLMQTQSAVGSILQHDTKFATAVATNNKAALREAVREIMEFPSVDFVTVCDTKGVVLMRGHSNQAGDTLPQTRVSMRVPLAEGRSVVGMEPGSVVKLSLATGEPIRLEGKIVGVAILGTDISSGDFVAKVKNMLKAECTIFLGDTRISTTVMTKEGKPAIDTKLNNDAIYQRVIGKGETVLTRNTIMGIDYDTAYWPWKDMTGKNAGMLFVGLSRDKIKNTQTEIVLHFALIGLVVGAIMLAIGAWVARRHYQPTGSGNDVYENRLRHDRHQRYR